MVTYEPGRLSWFEPDSATERVLVELATSYTAKEKDGIPHFDITRDLNRDGRVDVLVPDVDGYWISMQRSDGSFSEVIKVGPRDPFLEQPRGNLEAGDGPATPSSRSRDVGPTASTLPFYLSRVHELDYDQDGRSDLVFWNKDHFDVHFQDEHGLFATVAETFATDVPIDSEGAYSRADDFRDQGVFSILFGFGKNTQRTGLHSLRDLNGDHVADLITLTLSGRSITRQQSVYKVHFGKSTPEGIVFAQDAGAVIRPRGKAGAMQPWGYASQWLQDFDGDGQVDFMFRDVNVGLGGMMHALVGHSVPINLEFYRSDDGVYPAMPTTSRKIRRFAPFARLGTVCFPAVMIGDVNGDGRSDLVIGQSPEELRVFPGVPDPDLFAMQPVKVAIDLPDNEQNSRVVDLNKDKKQDILVHHASPTQPNRVTMLIAR